MFFCIQAFIICLLIPGSRLCFYFSGLLPCPLLSPQPPLVCVRGQGHRVITIVTVTFWLHGHSLLGSLDKQTRKQLTARFPQYSQTGFTGYLCHNFLINIFFFVWLFHWGGSLADWATHLKYPGVFQICSVVNTLS